MRRCLSGMSTGAKNRSLDQSLCPNNKSDVLIAQNITFVFTKHLFCSYNVLYLLNREIKIVTTAAAVCKQQLECVKPTLDDAMQTAITHPELIQFLNFARESKQPGVEAFTIVEIEDSKFMLHLDLAFKGKGIVFHTARKEPRAWANLNSLASYIKSLRSPDAPVTLRLMREPNETVQNPDQDA